MDVVMVKEEPLFESEQFSVNGNSVKQESDPLADSWTGKVPKQEVFESEKDIKIEYEVDLLPSIETVTLPSDYPCKQCNTVFNSEYKFKIHNERFHGPPKQCPKCPKKFEMMYQLNMHFSAIHRGLRFNYVENRQLFNLPQKPKCHQHYMNLRQLHHGIFQCQRCGMASKLKHQISFNTFKALFGHGKH
jgi:hypothetical protein